MESGVVIEWASFEVVEGVDQARLLAASAALQADFLGQQPGFLRRELLKGPGNQWVDLVYWASQAAAMAAMEQAMASPACATYFQLMVATDHADPAAGVLHLAQVATYPAAGPTAGA